ncbi:hypothetical protein LSTR_LSTR006421 [Laodelphax striatellus]|uniref:Uncharacterized protein n=1 Tax=Laodelphax striatellus TaxID=195883 RepID=A0A482WVW6_LAOST|nr:hypothetical protein LSTR_LSTR013715 [Laodelphax striatellus]RZF38022.1 hypothetical protein LSTR_LSTR006421 [Laodelphax striatellus]
MKRENENQVKNGCLKVRLNEESEKIVEQREGGGWVGERRKVREEEKFGEKWRLRKKSRMWREKQERIERFKMVEDRNERQIKRIQREGNERRRKKPD